MTTYGDKICPVCRLTVAPYINGSAIRRAVGPVLYVHYRCRDPATPDPIVDYLLLNAKRKNEEPLKEVCSTMYPIDWKPSPHFTPRVRAAGRPPNPPPLIVLHTMAGSLNGTLAHFQNPTTKVSSHYGVGRRGEIHQYVKETDGAWTNGRVLQPSAKQVVQRGGNPNRYTITIEFEGKDRGGAIDEPQYQAGLWLIRQIAERWHIPLTREYIIGHYEIDGVNKVNCPGPFFPWSRLMKDLQTERTLVSICANGHPIALGYLDNGTTYAPIRKVAEALGYEVRWEELTRRVNLVK